MMVHPTPRHLLRKAGVIRLLVTLLGQVLSDAGDSVREGEDYADSTLVSDQ